MVKLEKEKVITSFITFKVEQFESRRGSIENNQCLLFKSCR